MATREEVLEFLRVFKVCSGLGCMSTKGREKNLQGLEDLGLTANERREIIMGLEPEDYVAGPKEDDTDYTKEIWVFGKTVGETAVYIKLRVTPDPRKKNTNHALVWSFHRAEFPLKYPLKGGGS